jgi:glycerol-3-phosphate dehydrogenase (NAD(P)+)
MASGTLAGRKVGNGEHQLGARGEFAIDSRDGGSRANAASHAPDLDFEPQGVARLDLALEAHAVDAGEKGHLATMLFHAEQRHRANLCQCFDNEHARHYRVIGEVTLKEWLVHGDVLDANRADAVLDLNDAIDEKKRIAVRDNRLNLLGVEHVASSFLKSAAASSGRQSRNDRQVMSNVTDGAAIPSTRDDSEVVAVLGAGAWGTTLATLLARQGVGVTLVAHSIQQAEEMATRRENARYLPGVELPSSLEMSHTTPGATLMLLCVPSHAVRAAMSSVAAALDDDSIVVCCSKGLEPESLARLSTVTVEAAGLRASQVAALSGPNLAREIASGLPASAVVASGDTRSATRAQRLLGSPRFRVYTSDDIVGVELGGALKNVVAIAAGIADGRGMGQNAKAALMTRGLAEMMRLGVALGAQPLTFGGLSGLGDLIATCESPLSRNRSFGELLGKGIDPARAIEQIPHVVEGAPAARAMVELGRRHGVDTPIAGGVVAILDGTATIDAAIDALLTRDARPEDDGLRRR